MNKSNKPSVEELNKTMEVINRLHNPNSTNKIIQVPYGFPFIDDCGTECDTTKPFIRVMSFKESGKWYSSKNTLISPDHLKIINSMEGFELLDKFKANDSDIEKYSPLSSGFKDSGMVFIVQAFNVEGFFLYMFKGQGQ